MVLRVKSENVSVKKKAAVISLIVGVSLMLIKFAGYFVTTSTAILSDALESFVNIVTAVFTLISVTVASRPADSSHPYGHGKIEFISAGFEGAAILGAAVLIIYEVINEFSGGVKVENLGMGLLLVGIATASNAILGFYLLRTGKKTGSISIEADGRHVMTDVLTSIGVLIGVLLIRLTGIMILDPIIAIVVSVNIIFIGFRLIRRSFGGMMDEADSNANKMIQLILNSPELKKKVCGFHHLRSRKSGGFNYVDFHLLVPRDIDIASAHAIATDVEVKIADALGEAGVMAHIEPCKDIHCKTCEIFDCKMRKG